MPRAPVVANGGGHDARVGAEPRRAFENVQAMQLAALFDADFDFDAEVDAAAAEVCSAGRKEWGVRAAEINAAVQIEVHLHDAAAVVAVPTVGRFGDRVDAREAL